MGIISSFIESFRAAFLKKDSDFEKHYQQANLLISDLDRKIYIYKLRVRSLRAQGVDVKSSPELSAMMQQMRSQAVQCRLLVMKMGKEHGEAIRMVDNLIRKIDAEMPGVLETKKHENKKQ